MNSLISVNRKFMKVNPKRLIEMIISSKYVKGIEINVDYNDELELKYLNDLVFEIKKYNLILSIHANTDEDLNSQITFLKKIENYSDCLGYKIVVTFHSIYDENKNESIIKTTDYINSIIDKIDNNKLVICLENLNDMFKKDRLEKESITSLVLNNELLFFTYDMGHELADHKNITDLNEYMIEEIRNVHIHSVNDLGTDHMPIYKNDKHINEIIKGLIFLVNNKYKYSVVFEYDLFECYGNNIEEKIKDYINSIDYVSSHM